MKKRFTLLIILICLLFISCNNNRNNIGDTKLQKGIDGLTVEFMKNMPKEVYEEGKIYSTFEMRNGGFFDIDEGILVPSIEKDLVEIDSWDLPSSFRKENTESILFDLKGKSLVNTRGEKQVGSIVLKARQIDDTRNKIESRIILNTCYPYLTIMSETICIDTDPNNLAVAKKTCKTKDITSSGQGAPIAITKIEQKTVPSDSKDSVVVQFTIYAENKGKGVIISKDRYKEVCQGKSLKKEDYNTIELKDLKFSDYSYEDDDFDCHPIPLREQDGKYYTRCTLKEENSISKNKLTFETPIVVELAYGYKTALSEEIEILSMDQIS
jgi:hypothetical protein